MADGKIIFIDNLDNVPQGEIAVWASNTMNMERGGGIGQAASAKGRTGWIALPTKLFGKRTDDAFLTDEALKEITGTDARSRAMKKAIDGIHRAIMDIKIALVDGKNVYMPSDGFGTGEAQLRERAPKLFVSLTRAIDKIIEDNVVEGKFTEKSGFAMLSEDRGAIELENKLIGVSDDIQDRLYDYERKYGEMDKDYIGILDKAIESLQKNPTPEQEAKVLSYDWEKLITGFYTDLYLMDDDPQEGEKLARKALAELGVKPTPPPEIPQKISATAAPAPVAAATPTVKTTAGAMNAGARTSTTRAIAGAEVGNYLDFSQDGVKGVWRIKEIVKYDFNNPADVENWESTEGWNFARIKEQGGLLLDQVLRPNSKTFILERVDAAPEGAKVIKQPMRYTYGPDGASFDPSFMKLNQTQAAAPAPRGVVDIVVAVGKLGKNGKVEGGTGWATEGALLRGIPTYVYDDMTSRWYTASSPQKSFQGWKTVDSPPTNVRAIAGIGSRTLPERGYQEIVSYVESLDKSVVIHSGGAGGADTAFEETHAKRGGEVVSHSFQGHSRTSKSSGLLVHSRDELVSTRDEVNAIGRSLGKSITWDKPDRRPGDSTEELVMRNMFQIEPGRVVPAQSAQAATNRAPVAPPSGNARLNAGAIPNNIYSNAGKNVNGMSRFERGLRAALTNPTSDLVNFVDTKSGREFPQDSYAQETITTKYPVVYEGKVFPSSEHAFFYYQNELNLSESPRDSAEQAATKLKRSEEIMGKIIAEKLRQHPKLVAGIEKVASQEGITGEEWIAKQSHYTGKADTRKPSHWTGDGLGSGFLRALSQAYSLAKQQPRSLPIKTDTASLLEHEMLVKWAQEDANWKYFPLIDRFGKFRSKQSYYVSGTVNSAVEVAASFQTKAAMAETVEQKALYEAQAKRVLDESKIDSGILRAWGRLSDLAVGKVVDPSARTRLARTVGATSAFGTYYDSPVQDKIAQLDPSVKGKTIPNVIADIAAENGIDLSSGKTRSFGIPTLESTDSMGTKTDIEETMRKFVVALRAVTDSKRKFKQVGISPDSRLGKGGTLSEKNARDLSLVIMKLSSILKDYADPALAIEAQKMQRFGGEDRRGTLSPGAELASKLVARGEALSRDRIEQISKFSRRQAEAFARAMGIEMGNIGESSKSYNRPLAGEADHSLPEQRFIDAIADSDGALGRKFQAAIEESYSFRLSPDGKTTPKESSKKSAKIAKAIATTMQLFPALAERVVPTPSGFTRSARGTSKPIFQLNSGYSPNFSSSLGAEQDAKLVGPIDTRVSDAVERESAATRAFASGEYGDKVVLVRLGNILQSGLKVGAAQADLFDALTKTYLTGNFASDLKTLEAKEKLVGPIAKLAGTGKKEINPIEVAAKYRENPDEKLILKLNTIEIAVDFETARKMGIIGPQGRSLPNLFAETVTGIISPQTYVSSNVRVLPGGAVISTDPAFIEAYGFPKVLPYMVEPTGDPKKPFRLKPVEVPDRGVETTTSGYVPTKSGGDKAKNIDYRREQLLREARGSKIFEDIAAKADKIKGGLPKGREETFDIDRRARLDFIISQIDILAETPSSWTSKEIFDQSMLALKGSMTESDFKNMTGSSTGGADDITGIGTSSRWNLSKNFQRLVALWDSPERDIMFADASKRWTAISGLEQYTNFVADGKGVRAVIPTITETEKMAVTDFSGPSEVVKNAEKYLPVEIVEIRDNDGKAKFVSATSEAARKYYLENGEILSRGRPNDTKSRDTLVSRSTDVTAKYPTIFPGDKSKAIEDLIIAVDDISQMAYRFAYALGYGSDMKPFGANESTPDVRVMQAIASTVSTLIDEEFFTFAKIFDTPTSLSQTGYERPIIPDFRSQAEVHLRVLETLQKQADFREVIDTETGVVLREKPANVPTPPEIKSFAKSQLEAKILRIEEAGGSAKDATELALLKRQYDALLNGERIPNYENIIRDASSVTVKDDSSPEVTAKLGKGIQGDPVEEIAKSLAASFAGEEDASVLRNVLGNSKLLDLFNEGPEVAAAAIIKRAWVIFGENATPELMKGLSFNYNGREYYGTMGVGPDGRPIMAVRPQQSNERFLPAENPLQSEPSVRQDTAARKALIVEAEKNVQAGTDTGQRDYLRAEDNNRTVVIRKASQWNGISEIVYQVFSEADKARLDALVRVFVDELLAEYVKPDGTRVTYDEVIKNLNYGELVKSGPLNITYRLFDHGINGDFKDIERFVNYSEGVRDRVDTVEIGGRYARDLGIDPETGRMIVGGADVPDGEIDARSQSELNTERSDINKELRSGPLGDGGFNPEVGSAEHSAMMAYEQGKMYGGLGLPWTRALSDIGRPLREAPGSMKAFHGRGGFGAGFAADAAYMAYKGYLDPANLAVSAGFNSINFLPKKYAPKVGLIGAAANLGLTAATGGDMGRAAMMTIGGLLGAAVGAFGGGFGAIGGSFAGSEIGDYIWSDVFGNKNNQLNKYGPKIKPNAPNAIKITPRISP